MIKSLGLALLAGALCVSTAGAVHDPDITSREFKCQGGLSKAAVKFVGAKQKCVNKCVRGARKRNNPEVDCFPPYGGAALSCIADLKRGAETKAIAAIDKACEQVPFLTDCPECYSARSGPADCSAHGFAVVVGGLSNPPAPSLEAQVDAFAFLYCNDGGANQTATETKCESRLAKALVQFVGCKNECYDGCFGAMHRGAIPMGSCAPPLPAYVATQNCLFDPITGCEAKAIAACDKACTIPPADAPECYGFSCSSIVALVETAVDGNIPTNYCGSPSGAFVD